jgi:hypothetical protein
MYTLCIRYTLDPNRLKHFRDYVEHELAAIRNAGRKIVGYWLPTDFAGPNTQAGMASNPSLPAYTPIVIASGISDLAWPITCPIVH